MLCLAKRHGRVHLALSESHVWTYMLVIELVNHLIQSCGIHHEVFNVIIRLAEDQGVKGVFILRYLLDIVESN